jgi:toxin ParE1/3/4
MSYSVNFTVRADRDLALLFEAIQAESSEAALKWYRGLKDAILRLEKAPERCPHTPESPKFRHLLYGRKPHVYRVIYQVLKREQQVHILHIRHGARRPIRKSDLK